MRALRDCQLYTFVDTAHLHGRSPDDVARQLCDGGADIIQLRAKRESRNEVKRIAEMVMPITQAAGVPLVINDYVDVARQVGAQFVHLGQEDFFAVGFIHSAQVVEDSPLKVGLSSHAPEQAERAVVSGAAYIAIGPVFATPTKPERAAVTVDYVRWAATHVSIPWFAIGGINLQTIDRVMAAGAKRICVVSAILNAPDITLACGAFKRRLAAAS